MTVVLLATVAVANTASAVPIHRHVVRTEPVGLGAVEVPYTDVVKVDVAPRDSDDDGCRNSRDSFDGPGCNAPKPVAVSVPEVVAPAPVTTSVAPSSVGAPVDITCESGGDYSINTGNGYYGAYQFDSSTWDAYGDSSYAEANEAPPAVQDAAAASVPYDAWPNC